MGPSGLCPEVGCVALAGESVNAADCAKPLTARYIEKLLRERGTFPKKYRGSKQPPK